MGDDTDSFVVSGILGAPPAASVIEYTSDEDARRDQPMEGQNSTYLLMPEENVLYNNVASVSPSPYFSTFAIPPTSRSQVDIESREIDDMNTAAAAF